MTKTASADGNFLFCQHVTSGKSMHREICPIRTKTYKHAILEDPVKLNLTGHSGPELQFFQCVELLKTHVSMQLHSSCQSISLLQSVLPTVNNIASEIQ